MLLQAKKELRGESNIYKESSCLNKSINKLRSFSLILILIKLFDFPSSSIFARIVLDIDLVLSILIVELESSSLLLKEEVEELKEEFKELLLLLSSLSSSS